MANPDLKIWRDNAASFQSENAQQTLGIALERYVEMPVVLGLLDDVEGKIFSTPVAEAGS